MADFSTVKRTQPVGFESMVGPDLSNFGDGPDNITGKKLNIRPKPTDATLSNGGVYPIPPSTQPRPVG